MVYRSTPSFIHFGLTSQDINNTAIPLSFLEAQNEVILPLMNQVLTQLKDLSKLWKDIPMLAHTHGQPASPTTLGKEIYVFVYRLERQMAHLQNLPFTAKFGGATGNMNAHYVAYPNIIWTEIASSLLAELGLKRQDYTTQIANYDGFSNLFNAYKASSTILLDLSRDIWQYISMHYFRQKTVKNEVGSSAMPHKVNPIDLENAEGNLGIAIALFNHLADKLPVSRLQRDLSDSTVLRNIGVPLAHILIALKSLKKGLAKIEVNEEQIGTHLRAHVVVLAEAVQTILRRENYPKPYEALKDLTRGKDLITQADLYAFIQKLDIPEQVRQELLGLRVEEYVGNADTITP